MRTKLAGGVCSCLVIALVAVCAHGPRRLNPHAVALGAAGAASLAAGDLDRAAGQFSLALEYEPRMASAYNGLGLVALRRGEGRPPPGSLPPALPPRAGPPQAQPH